MIRNYELCVLAPDKLVVYPKTGVWVIVEEHLLSGSYLQLPVYIERYTVGLVARQIVAFSVLCVLRRGIRFELNN